MADPRDLFEKVFVINLRERADRLKAFFGKIAEVGWPFKRPEVWEAVPGGSGKIPCPISFTEGGGAFGCRQSHVGILQHCIMNDVESVLVLEDDADFRSTFMQDCMNFARIVPDDWQGIMLGGQHHAPPTKISDGLVKVNNGQRTHAYGCRGEYMRGLYARWACANVHIDWLMRDWQGNYRVYAPERWLIGQARSKSNINGRIDAATFWNPVECGKLPVVVLHAPPEVARQLGDRGLHTGYQRNSEDLDVGLAQVFRAPPQERRGKLSAWIEMIQYECGQTDNLICTVWHPAVTGELVRQATEAPVYEVTAETVEAAIGQLPPEIATAVKGSSNAPERVVVLHAPRAVVEELRREGFHFGYWRGDDGIDNGLRSIFATEIGRVPKLRKWIEELRGEARNFGGIVAAWHPSATRELLHEAGAPMGMAVVEINADSTPAALEQSRAA